MRALSMKGVGFDGLFMSKLTIKTASTISLISNAIFNAALVYLYLNCYHNIIAIFLKLSWNIMPQKNFLIDLLQSIRILPDM
jgi:hypothetical protein